jgi:hypothetical protein
MITRMTLNSQVKPATQYSSPTGERNHQIIDSGQPPLPLANDHRLECRLPIPRHLNLHRPGLGHQRLRPRPIPRISPIATHRIMLAVTKMIIHLALQGGLNHHLGQPTQASRPPGQLQTLSTRPIDQLPDQLLLQALRRLGRHIHRHKSHRCLSSLKSYTNLFNLRLGDHRSAAGITQASIGVAPVTPVAPAGVDSSTACGPIDAAGWEWLKRGLHCPKLVCPPRRTSGVVRAC